MNGSTIAAKLRGRLVGFLGRISPRFRKPTAKFVGDMVYGLVARGDVKLSSIVRALDEKTSPKKVEDRLSRMLASEGLAAGLHDAIASCGRIFTCLDAEMAVSSFVYKGSAFSASRKMGNLQAFGCRAHLAGGVELSGGVLYNTQPF